MEVSALSENDGIGGAKQRLCTTCPGIRTSIERTQLIATVTNNQLMMAC